MSKIAISTEKERLSEAWVESQSIYSEFYDEFVKEFELNLIQCCALRRLCDLAETYALATADRRAAELSPEEARSTYENMMVECWGTDWRDAV